MDSRTLFPLQRTSLMPRNKVSFHCALTLLQALIVLGSAQAATVHYQFRGSLLLSYCQNSLLAGATSITPTPQEHRFVLSAQGDTDNIRSMKLAGLGTHYANPVGEARLQLDGLGEFFLSNTTIWSIPGSGRIGFSWGGTELENRLTVAFNGSSRHLDEQAMGDSIYYSDASNALRTPYLIFNTEALFINGSTISEFYADFSAIALDTADFTHTRNITCPSPPEISIISTIPEQTSINQDPSQDTLRFESPDNTESENTESENTESGGGAPAFTMLILLLVLLMARTTELLPAVRNKA